MSILRILFDTRHPAENNMCKRLVFHYVSPFQHYHHHPITLPATTFRSGRQKLLFYRMCPQQMCAKILLLLRFCFVLVLFDDIEIKNDVVIICKTTLVANKCKRQPNIVVSFDSLQIICVATANLPLASE